MSPWGWKTEPTQGVWRHGAKWLRPFVSAAPWLTVLLLLLQFHLIGGNLLAAKGVLFDLPDAALSEGENARLVAVVMPQNHDTLVFFDDARYVLGDGVSMAALGRHVADCVQRRGDRTLVMLADRTVSSGDLMKLVAHLRKHGIAKVLVAEKRAGAVE